MSGGYRRRFQLPWRGRTAAAAEVDEEIRFHLDQRAQALVGQGVDPDEALARARREFGDLERARADLLSADLSREVRVRRRDWVGDVRRDLAYSFRRLRRSPAWALVTVLTLAIGIGAATAGFAAFDGVLRRPLPMLDPDRLVVLETVHPGRGDANLPLSYLDVRAFGERGVTLEALAAVEYNRPAESVVRIGAEVLMGRGARVTGDLFGVLGVVPVLGRTLTPVDDVPGAEPVVVLGHGFWVREFAADPDVLGRLLEWNGVRHTVVGVAPEGFAFPGGAEFWTAVIAAVPGALEAAEPPSATTFFHGVGRLRPGRTSAQLADELQLFLTETDPLRDPALRGARAVVTPLPELLLGGARAPVLAVHAAGLLVLLLTCFNVAGLLLLSGGGRRRELAIRLALGAGRGRILRQQLAEALLLGLVGGLLGFALAWAILQALLAAAPPEFPRIDTVRMDRAALGFASASTLAAVLLSATVPALWVSSSADLRGAGTAAGSGVAARRLGGAIVVGQAAIAVVIVAGAALLLRSVENLRSLDLMFEAERLSIAQLQLPAGMVLSRAAHVDLVESAVQRLAMLPGIESVAALPVRPFADSGGWDALISAEGQPPDERAANPLVNFEVVSPEYFGTLRIPILLGRGFTAADHEEAQLVAVISRSVADRFWPGGDPIGRRIRIGEPGGPLPWHTVVGVVPETRYRELVEPRPSLYFATRQFGGPVPMRIAVRASADPREWLPAARAALRELNPDLLLADPRTLPELVSANLATSRFSAMLIGVYAAVATLLAAVGLFGLMGSLVRQQRPELAVRLALGASRRAVVRFVLERGLGLIVLGGVIGIAVVLVGGRLLSALLFGVSPHDPATLFAACLLLFLASAAACVSPVRRAIAIDPAESLRDG